MPSVTSRNAAEWFVPKAAASLPRPRQSITTSPGIWRHGLCLKKLQRKESICELGVRYTGRPLYADTLLICNYFISNMRLSINEYDGPLPTLYKPICVCYWRRRI